MRRTRSDVISMLAIGLLIGSSVMVVAQDREGAPGADTATLVSGEVVWTAGTGFEEETQSDGILRQRGRELIGTTDMSDERLNGELTMRYDTDVFVAGGLADILWGAVSLVSDEAAWDGRLVGTSDTTTGSGEGSTYFELLGSGAYEGLSAVLFMPERVDPETGESVYPLSGVIFPGELPPDRPGSAVVATPEATSSPTPVPAADASSGPDDDEATESSDRPGAVATATPEATSPPTPVPSSEAPSPSDDPAASEPEGFSWAGISGRIGSSGDVSVDVALGAFAATIGPLPGVEGVAAEAHPFAGSEAVRWLLGNWDALTEEQRAMADSYLQPPTGGDTSESIASAGFGLMAMIGLPQMAAGTAQGRLPCHMDPALLPILSDITFTINKHQPLFPRDLPITPCIVDAERWGQSPRALALNKDLGYVDGEVDSCWLLLPEPLVATPEFELHRREILAYHVFQCAAAVYAQDLSVLHSYPSWILGGAARWVGAKLADAPPVLDGSWTAWSTTPERSLFSRSLDAVGFWELLNKDYLPLPDRATWEALEVVLVGLGSAAEPRSSLDVGEEVYAAIMDSAFDDPILDAWGPSYHNMRHESRSWRLERPESLRFPNPPFMGGNETQTEQMGNGDSLELRARPYSASATTVGLNADVIVVDMPPGFLANGFKGTASVVSVTSGGLQSVGNATFAFVPAVWGTKDHDPDAGAVHGRVLFGSTGATGGVAAGGWEDLPLAELGPVTLCRIEGGCECPLGSLREGSVMKEATSQFAFFGLTGHQNGSAVHLTGYSLDEFCSTVRPRDPERYVLSEGQFEWVNVGGIDNSGCQWPTAETKGALTLFESGGIGGDWLDIDTSQDPWLYRISVAEWVTSDPVMVPECRSESGQRKYKAGLHRYSSLVTWIDLGSVVPSPGDISGFDGHRTWNDGQNISTWQVWPVDGRFGWGEDGPPP